jgi:fatty acid kinase fatty acid binding subunit
MARPTVLVVDADGARRKELTHSLAEYAYEVVSAEKSAEGMRFAIGLTPNLIVATSEMEGFGDLTVLKYLAPQEGAPMPKLLLMVEGDPAGLDLPEEVLAIGISDLSTPAIVRKLRTVLIGRELDLEPDERLESLVGDLQMLPLFELLPQLQKVVLSGRVIVEDGEISLRDGEVVTAHAGKVHGLKAFTRLARVAAGSFRVLLGATAEERELTDDLLSLMANAMEDQHRFEDAVGRLPDWESRVRIVMGPAFFDTHFTPTQQSALQTAQEGQTVRALVDAVAASDGEMVEELLRLNGMGFVAFDEPEVKVRVVTDSTSDLPHELARLHGIEIVPLSVLFGEEIFKDGVDLAPGAFYKMLAARKDVHPRTSPPSKGEFLIDYRQLVARRDVVSIHISEKMSLTVAHAREAAEAGGAEFEKLRADGSAPAIEVIDSRQVSAGLGLLAIFAARMAQRLLGAGEIRARIEEMRQRLHLLFVVDTLEYLARGGRIGKARALLGGLLGIKPILGLVDGEVAPVDRVRGGRAAHPRVVELFKGRVDATRPVVVCVSHAAAPVWADRLQTLLQESFTISELLQSEIGPVVGTHAGPGCVGAVMFQPSEDEAPLIAPLEA